MNFLAQDIFYEGEFFFARVTVARRVTRWDAGV